MQRMALASRELRQLAAEHSLGDIAMPATDLKVPKSVSSLYDRAQMSRIVEAAGGNGDVFQQTEIPSGEDNDIELF